MGENYYASYTDMSAPMSPLSTQRCISIMKKTISDLEVENVKLKEKNEELERDMVSTIDDLSARMFACEVKIKSLENTNKNLENTSKYMLDVLTTLLSSKQSDTK